MNVRPYVLAPTEQQTTEVKTVKTINEYGVKVEYTNNKTVISSTENIKIAVA